VTEVGPHSSFKDPSFYNEKRREKKKKKKEKDPRNTSKLFITTT
jgi:hypothetical protein